MTEPTITCPSCSTDIKLTESLAAPLIRATREEYEAKLSRKEADVSKREAALRTELEQVEQARRSIEDQVAERLKAARTAIAAEEARELRRRGSRSRIEIKRSRRPTRSPGATGCEVARSAKGASGIAAQAARAG